MMKRSFAAIFLSFLFIGTLCQETSDTLYTPGTVSLDIKNINFIKNNEYQNPVTEGYTLIGFFIQPSVVYTPYERISLKLGAHILGYSGKENTLKPDLVFSTSYRITRKIVLTLGTLDGSEKHRLFDPHYNMENVWTDNCENGLQIRSEGKHLFSDTWLRWENYIFKGDTAREVFTAGESFNYLTPAFGRSFSLEFPVQLLFKHYGGQISDYDEKVVTYFNGSAGIKINYDISGGSGGRVSAEYLHFIFNETTGKGEAGVTEGNASWFRFHYSYKPFRFLSGYWRSHDYFAPDGNPVFMNVSDYQEDLVLHHRDILTNSFYLSFRPKSYFSIHIGFDTYYDLNLKHMDTAMSLHLNFENFIRLATLN